MKTIQEILRGVLIGLANIIPGVSGGTMTVVFGLYERLIDLVANLRTKWRKELPFILVFGLGAGRGLLKRVFAADSDLAFAAVSEEWGLIMGCLTVLCIVALGLFALRTVSLSRSSFYAIGACTAAGILLIVLLLISIWQL